MRVMILVFGTVGLAALGCGGGRIALRPGAERIQIVTTLPADGSYEPISDVSCSRGENFRTAGANTERCRTDVRNQALDLSTDLVLLTTQTVGAGQCANCVILAGTAYRRRARAP
jgi:hypothetical protein